MSHILSQNLNPILEEKRYIKSILEWKEYTSRLGREVAHELILIHGHQTRLKGRVCIKIFYFKHLL